MQLRPANIDRDHGNGAGLEEAISEPSRGGANVEAVTARGGDTECCQRRLELPSAAAHIAGLSNQLDGRCFIEKGCGLHEDCGADADAPGHDQLARPLTRFNEAPLDEEKVGAHTSHG